MNSYSPLREMLLVRLKLFIREPEAIFWTYGFPLLMIVGLGIAFRTGKPEPIWVDVIQSEQTQWVVESLEKEKNFVVKLNSAELAKERLRVGKASLVVNALSDKTCEYQYDPTRPESKIAYAAVNDALQKAAGRQETITVINRELTERGSRYIDFLVPGLIGMNLMGAGMWGVGFTLVDMRMRNLLKRLVATPMRRRDFLLSMVLGRAMFFIPEILMLLLCAWLLFDVPIVGNMFSIIWISFLGAMCFAGLGLLVACRANRIETVSGLMNMVMLPMWLCSGTFFSAERFPEIVQPVVQALPLTQLNNALRAVVLEGTTLSSLWLPQILLLAIGGISFYWALRWFRWT